MALQHSPSRPDRGPGISPAERATTPPSPPLPRADRGDLTAWATDLRCQGYTMLPASHAVPVVLWLRTREESVLQVTARGTRIALRAYRASDLTGLLLRSECDCAQHRRAGAARRTMLRPGAVPWHEAVIDGAHEFGWRSHEAGLLTIVEAVPLVDRLLAAVPLPARPVTAKPVSRSATRLYGWAHADARGATGQG